MARAGLGSPYATFVQAAAEASTMAEASANPTTAAAEAAANQETAEATAVPTSDPGTPNPTTPQQFRLHTPLDSGATTIKRAVGFYKDHDADDGKFAAEIEGTEKCIVSSGRARSTAGQWQ